MKRIDKLTPAQEARLPEWREKWIQIGLRTGETDWETFDKYMPVCFEKAGIPYPKNVVRVSSPLVGALAASIANRTLNSKDKTGAVGDAVGDAVDGAVGDAVDDAVDGAVRDAVRGAVDDAVDGAVRDAVDGAVGGAVGDAVDDAVDGAVRDAVGDAVDGAVRDAVRGAVDDAVGDAKLTWHYWLGGQFWVGYYWYGSPANTSFFREVCELKLTKDIEERAIAYQRVCESVNYIWPNKDFVMVCARPTRIKRDEQGRLHSDTDKAIEYPDGWGLYILDGLRLDEELWTRIVSKTMSFEEIMKIPNTDHRMVALKYNPQALINSGAELVDKSKRGNELFKIERKEINKILEFPKIWFLRFQCPTGRTFIEGVDPQLAEITPKADVCQAAALGLTFEQYQLLKQET
jgi:hypothetical protein